MAEHIPRHDHLLRARPEGEVLRRMEAQARRSRLDRQTLIQKSGAAAATLAELDQRVGDVQRDFDAQKVGQRQYVVDANGFGTHLTVQEAVTEAIAGATAAAPTAVIYINPGVYVENIIVAVEGTDLTAMSFVAEGIHGTASELVFPSEVEGDRQFVAAVIIQPDDSTNETFDFTGGTVKNDLFITFTGIQIDGNLHIADGDGFVAKIRLVDSYINYTGSGTVFEDSDSTITADVLILRSLIIAPNAKLFSSIAQWKLFGMTSRIEVDKIEDLVHSGTASIGTPLSGTIAALQTCHLEIGTSGFEGEYLFLLLLSTTVVCLDTTALGGVKLIDAKVVGNIGLIGMVVIDDEDVRTNNLIDLDDSSGLVTGVNLYARGVGGGTAINIADTNPSSLTIAHNRINLYSKGVDCTSLSSLVSGSVIGPNVFTGVTTPYTNVDPRTLHQWPLMKVRVAIPRPVAILSVNALFIPVTFTTPTNVVAVVGLVHLDSPLEVTKLTYHHNGGGAVGAIVRVALYSEDGQTKFFDVTDAVGNAAASDRTVNITQQVLPAGNYYIFFCAATATVIPTLFAYDTFGAGSGVLAAPTGAEHDIEGAISIGAGLAPSTFDPTSFLLAVDDSTVIFRLDGVAS